MVQWQTMPPTDGQQERLFQNLFESSPDAIFIEDMDGIVVDCNPAAATLHRTTREAIIGKHVSQLVPPERREQIVIYSPNAPREFEGESLTADGKTLPVWIRSSRIEYNGKPALLLHVRDIADRKQIEEELRRTNDELELRVQSRTAALARANEILREEIRERAVGEEVRRQLEEEIRSAHKMEAVGRLAGGVAHDFNNLLTVIIGRCEVILGQFKQDHPIRPNLNLIHEAARKAASVTRQLLAFGRKQVLQPVLLDLNAVISNMEDMLRSLISENIDLHLDLEPDLCNVEADRGQIEQVIMNLVVNAIDAMPHGGTLRVITSNTDPASPPPGVEAAEIEGRRYAVIAVQDTGSGMDEETLSHAFEPFFTTKDGARGTGLGLPTAYGIVKQSGGYIWATSQPDQGTSVRVYLPEVAGKPKAIPRNREAPPRGTETILITEDNDAVRRLTRELLEVCGYTALEAGDAEEALEKCAEFAGTIHLTLTDVVMPGMDGRELAERVVCLRPGMKVLLMSGYAQRLLKGGALHPGVHFIEKPFTTYDLARKIRDVLDQ